MHLELYLLTFPHLLDCVFDFIVTLDHHEWSLIGVEQFAACAPLRRNRFEADAIAL